MPDDNNAKPEKKLPEPKRDNEPLKWKEPHKRVPEHVEPVEPWPKKKSND